ncbi:MAG: SLBB domain-containing protein [Candidatus Zixiibacteriota bacterium]
MRIYNLFFAFFLFIVTFSYSLAEDIPTFDQPIDPDLYLIRPNEQLLVTFTNSQLDSLILEVDSEGRITHKTLGVFDLTNKTLTHARELLEEALRLYYKFDNVAITISVPRMVTITVTGAVKKPGTYKELSSFRVTKIINKAGGIYRDASRRRIIFSGGIKDIQVDIDKAAYLSDFASNPYLYAGNSIYVPPVISENIIHIVGEVYKPREIELVPGDNLELLLELAGGVRSMADTQAIQIITKSNEIAKDTIRGGDIIIVPALSDTSKDNKIIIYGAVAKPGFYEFHEGMTLGNLIKDAGGFLPDANNSLTTVFRQPRVDNSGRLTDIRFPFAHVTNGHNFIVTLQLKADDSIFVPVKVGYVKVFGEVSVPGYYPYFEGKDAMFYISSASGFLPTANNEEISIFNPISKITSTASLKVIISDGSVITVNIREELK